MRKSDVAEYHFHAFELGSLLAERNAATTAPTILRRSLSYVYREPVHRPGPALDLQLQLSAGAGGESGEATDVLLVALCVARSGAPQAFVPLAARVLLLPQAPGGPSSVQLPLELPGIASGGTGSGGTSGGAAGASRLSSRLSLLLLHQRSTQLATLVSLTSWQRSTSGGRQQEARCGGKPLSPAVTARLAFQLLPSGSQVGYSIIPLDDLLRGSHSGATKSLNLKSWQRPGHLEGRLVRQAGVITCHLPGLGTADSPALGIPWIQLQQQGKEQQHTGSGGGNGGGTAFRYTLRVVPGDTPSAQQQQPPQEEQQQHAGRAASKREAAGGPGDAVANKRAKSVPDGGDASAPRGQQGTEMDLPAALPAVERQQRQQCQQVQQQQQGEGPPRQPVVSFFFCSYDGTRSVRACVRGWACPLESCRGLRCHSYAGLQQHMQATHAYHSYFFSEAMPDGGAEVFLRCKPGWCDAQGSFLPRQLSAAALEAHPLSPYLARTRILRVFSYECPRRQRALRRPGAGGAYPGDEEEEEAEAEAAAEHLGGEEEEDTVVSAPSSSLPRSSCVTTALADDSEGEGYGGRTSARGGSKPLGKAQPPAAAAAAARLGKSKASGGGGTAAARLRKQAAAHVRRQGQGLTLLNHQGRPKFYHSRTCVAMTRQELTGAATVDSDSEGDFAEWQRDCRERLAEQAQLCAEEREFMFEWNLWVRSHPIHADADLPDAVAAFAAAHAGQLSGDTPFRRCLTAYLLNLWRFRLLTPQQLHQLVAGLPRIAGSSSGPVPGSTAVNGAAAAVEAAAMAGDA